MKIVIRFTIVIFIVLFAGGCSKNPPNYLKEGEALLQAKTTGNEKFYLAAELFRKELKIHPNSTQAQIDLAVAYDHLGQHNYAIQILTDAISEKQKSLEMLYHSRGLEKFIKNNYGEAIEDFRTALQFTDSSEQIIYKNIVYSKLWQKYYRNEKWLKFEKKEIADLIREVYPKNYKTPTVEEFIKGN